MRWSLKEGRLEVLEPLGQGGMGVVYRGFDYQRGRAVAVKSLIAVQPQQLLALKNEFRAVASLDHPNLVRLHDLFEENGQWYLTMELIEGAHFLNAVRGEATALEDIATQPVSMLAPRRDDLPTLPLAPAAAPPTYDESRLRQIVAQLLLGLDALHRAHRVHCDLKPSNIMIEPGGRVVVLDLGLAVEAGSTLRRGRETILGTASYMSPEHAAGEPVTPASDLYGVGTLLFEALTGHRPFEGPPDEVLMNKRTRAAPSVRDLVPDSPADLAALCDDLLKIEPALRPDTREALTRLGRPPARLTGRSPLFVGRASQLAALDQALEAVRHGQPRAVLLSGESGIGKSALLRRFLDGVRLQYADAWVLHSRCFERSSVPYKAFDGALDALVLELAKLDEHARTALLPSDPGALIASFPVFSAFAQGAPTVADPRRLQVQLFESVRELLARVGAGRLLVLAVDDLQWVDEDSLAMLAEVLRPGNAPMLLFVATARQTDERLLTCLEAPLTQLPVERLNVEESLELWNALEGAPAEGARLAREAAGHPLFLFELAWHAGHGGRRAPLGLHLDDALDFRVREHSADERALLELSAMAGRPLPHRVLARALNLPLPRYFACAEALTRTRLAHTSGPDLDDTLEPYHDRIRETVVGRLPPQVRRERHLALTGALESDWKGRWEDLALHWEGAGELRKAAEFYARAADDAVRALAFLRAAWLFARAVELGATSPQEERTWRFQLAESLRHAGEGPAAAKEYLAAAAMAEPEEALDLKRIAAEVLLRAGETDTGFELLREVLAGHGQKLPEPRFTVLWLLAERARLALRGLTPKDPPLEPTPALLRRANTYWSTAMGMLLPNPIVAAIFHTRHLRLALDLGDVDRIAKGLGVDVLIESSLGRSWAHLMKRAELAQRMVEASGQPFGQTIAMMGRAYAVFDHGSMGEVVSLCDQIEALVTARCTGAEFELTCTRWLGLRARTLRGEWLEVSRRVPRMVRQAGEDGDWFASAMFSTGMLTVAWLTVDEPQTARAHLSEGLRHWARSGYHMEHAMATYGHATIDLYLGEPEAALERFAAEWPLFVSESLMRFRSFRYLVHHLRARASLAAAAKGGPKAPFWLKQAEADAKVVARYGGPGALGESLAVLAGVADARKRRANAVELLRRSAVELEKGERFMVLAAVRWRLSTWVGGEEREQLRSQAQDFMARQGVVRPEAALRLLAPQEGAL